MKVARGETVHVWDAEGRRYLDAISGAFCVQLGYSRPDLIRAMSESAARLPFARAASGESEESSEYARELLKATGTPFTRALFTCSGSEAVEVALKAAYRFQRAAGRSGRTGVAHLRGHFHGATLTALRVTGYRHRRAPFSEILGLEVAGPAAYCKRCWRGLAYPLCELACAASAMEGYAGAGPSASRAAEPDASDLAALILETIPAAGLGAPVPPPGYFARVRRECDARGALWIADEVLTGFGRVGALWAWQRLAERSEDLGAVPDIVAFGKGAGAGYAAIGGVLLSERVARALDSGPEGPFTHAQTYGGNPIACAVGRAVIAALEREGVYDRIRGMESRLAATLAPLARHANVYDVRGLGFLWGIELAADPSGVPFPRHLRVAERMEARCRDRGVLVYAGTGSADGDLGDHLLVAPPLIARSEHMEEIATALNGALTETLAEARLS